VDKFKKSKKSICHNCSNIDEICDSRVSITCGSDSKVQSSFVEKCGSFNKPIVDKANRESMTISVGHKADTRVETMGGGHKDPEKP